METLNFLQKWYAQQCNGDWEHTYGVKIETLDNPGWRIEIDLIDTALENQTIEKQFKEIDPTNWYLIQIQDNKFMACGDSSKLDFLLLEFKKIAEPKQKYKRLSKKIELAKVG